MIWMCGSVVEYLPNLCKTLGSIPITKKNQNNKQINNPTYIFASSQWNQWIKGAPQPPLPWFNFLSQRSTSLKHYYFLIVPQLTIKPLTCGIWGIFKSIAIWLPKDLSHDTHTDNHMALSTGALKRVCSYWRTWWGLHGKIEPPTSLWCFLHEPLSVLTWNTA